MLQQLLFHSSEFYSVLHYLSDNRFTLILSALFVTLSIFCWNYFFVYQKPKSWLKHNKYLITEYRALQIHLNDFGEEIPCCKNCNKRDMQLWNFQKQLLVVRCSACKMTYTFANGQNPLLLKVVQHIDDVKTLFSQLLSFRYLPFGKLLASELKVDMAELNKATSPLAIIHFTAGGEHMLTSQATKNIDIIDSEVVLPEHLPRIAV